MLVLKPINVENRQMQPPSVIQRREDGSVNFFRGWESYREGFGKITGEHWLVNSCGSPPLPVQHQLPEGRRHQGWQGGGQLSSISGIPQECVFLSLLFLPYSTCDCTSGDRVAEEVHFDFYTLMARCVRCYFHERVKFGHKTGADSITGTNLTALRDPYAA
ncbi:unnamed protein product [Pleuronectes platessa]|uniref:Fibrinogen C-terminal domain-containing protein n=1 Tax=Pleuronectes platessa TaxID=8262 RepID=A0A9N7TTJ5_PLEPL|nr:unnamed protein product [Pleuronectes platessa]